MNFKYLHTRNTLLRCWRSSRQLKIHLVVSMNILNSLLGSHLKPPTPPPLISGHTGGIHDIVYFPLFLLDWTYDKETFHTAWKILSRGNSPKFHTHTTECPDMPRGYGRGSREFQMTRACINITCNPEDLLDCLCQYADTKYYWGEGTWFVYCMLLYQICCLKQTTGND